MGPDNPADKTLTGPFIEATEANTTAWRLADIGAANGHGNARSVARILSVVSRGGEVDGIRLLRPETVDLIFSEQANGVDVVLGAPLRFGIGYGLPQLDSLIIMDVGRRMTISYMMNKMGAGIVGSDRSARYIRAVYSALAG